MSNHSAFPWDMAFLCTMVIAVLVVAMLLIMAFGHVGFFA